MPGGLTLARFVALITIFAVTTILVRAKFGGAEPVTVPEGATAGDLVLEPCTYETEAGPYPADCGTLVVPENRTDPGSRLIALPVTRIHARTDSPAEPIFKLEGGPGMSNMEFFLASRYADDHDVVLVGYRGVDGSVRLDCPEVRSALEHSSDLLSEETLDAYAEGYRHCAKRLTDEGVHLPSYGLVQQIDDMEAARVALGYDRIDLLSESAGTRTAMIYTWRYPDSIHRSVMLGVNPPGNYLWDPGATDEQIARFAELCAADATCSSRTEDLAASIRRLTDDMPDRWFLLPIKDGNVQVMSITSLMQPDPQAGLTFDAWLSASEGDVAGLWFLSMVGEAMAPKLFVWGQYASAGSIDFEASREYFGDAGRDLESNLGYLGTSFSWVDGRLADVWPVADGVDEYTKVRATDVETLIVSGELDTSTPPQIATEQLLPYLPNGKEVVLPGFGHTPSLWYDQPEATARLINTYFDTGEVDTSLYEPKSPNFTPGMTGTALAKIVAGSMAGLAAITVLSLLAMARRVRKKGGLGPKSSAVLRTLTPVVFGLGGWALVSLTVMATGLAVPIDGWKLVVPSTGVPIGLGVYLAWSRRDRSRTNDGLGFAGALGGALVAAWLGYHCAAAGLSILTAIVGAAAGANLVLIVLDVAGGQKANDVAPAMPTVSIPALADV
jgi:pimeloyl-ACP methyl ester carboxylesterase